MELTKENVKRIIQKYDIDMASELIAKFGELNIELCKRNMQIDSLISKGRKAMFDLTKKEDSNISFGDEVILNEDRFTNAEVLYKIVGNSSGGYILENDVFGTITRSENEFQLKK